MTTYFTDRQQEIIKASVKLIASGGIQELTIKNISREMGISEAAIYRHFDSKMDILLAILSLFESFAKAQAEEANRTVNLEEISSLDQIGEFIKTRFAKLAQNPTFATVVFSEELFRNDKRLSEKVLKIMKIHQDTLLRMVKAGQRNGAIRTDVSAELITHIIMGSIRLTVAKWRMSDFSFKLEEEGARIWEAIRILIAGEQRQEYV